MRNLSYNSLFISTLALGMLLTANVMAHVLVLENGTKIEGTYIDATKDWVLFEVDGDVKTYALGDVKEIELSSPAVEASAIELVVVPAGTKLLVRMTESVDSKRHKAGHMFTSTLETDLVINDVRVASKGSRVYGKLISSKKGGNVAGKAELSLGLTDLTIDNKPYAIVTSSYAAKTEGEAKKTGKRIAAGAIIGGLIDGSSGAKTGAAVGGGVSILTKGSQVSVPAGTLLEFTLAGDLVVQ